MIIVLLKNPLYCRWPISFWIVRVPTFWPLTLQRASRHESIHHLWHLPLHCSHKHYYTHSYNFIKLRPYIYFLVSVPQIIPYWLSPVVILLSFHIRYHQFPNLHWLSYPLSNSSKMQWTTPETLISCHSHFKPWLSQWLIHSSPLLWKIISINHERHHCVYLMLIKTHFSVQFKVDTATHSACTFPRFHLYFCFHITLSSI